MSSLLKQDGENKFKDKKILLQQQKSKIKTPNKTSKMETINKPSTSRINLTKVKKEGPAIKSSNNSNSSRVVTTQFFPNKNMYANALKKSDNSSNKISKKEVPISSSRERNKTRTLSPSEILIAKNSEVEQANSARPGTATLEQSSFPLNLIQSEENDYTYEDDFDSYESDFDEYKSSSTTSNSSLGKILEQDTGEITSDDSETNNEFLETVRPTLLIENELDSGNFDLSMDNKRVISANSKVVENKSNMASLSDEGFEDSKTSLQLVDFLGAQHQYQLQRLQNKRKRRGQELLSMIRLDSQNATIFDLPPITYEEYIRLYGSSKNNMQISTQTGEDNLNEETQTNFIESETTWTQIPPKFNDFTNSYSREEFVEFRKDFLGVGRLKNTNNLGNYNENSLKKFLQSAGNLMINILNKQLTNQNNCEINVNENKNLVFSKGFLKLNLTKFIDKPIIFIEFSKTDCEKLLTIHKCENELSNNDEVGLKLRSFICLWNISTLTNGPELILSNFGYISCSCFSPNLIVSGNNDGSISVWNINNLTNKYGHSIKIEEMKVQLPNFTTSEIQVEHSNKIISLQSTDDKQILSLDEFGNLIIWGIILQPKICLVKNSQTCLNTNNFSCTLMKISPIDLNHIYVSTNLGKTLHRLLSGTKIIPKEYSAGNYLDLCPFSSQFFLSIFQDGSFGLFSKNKCKPLMHFRNENDELHSNNIVLWSVTKPCVFYTKIGNVINVWDLSISDIFPSFTVSFKEDIKSICLSPFISNEKLIKSYMVILFENGDLEIHVLNETFGIQSNEFYESNIQIFYRYVNRL